MTIGEYIKQKFQAWKVTDAQYQDLITESGLNIDDDYTINNMETVQRAIIPMVEELMLSPFVKNINENGFSLSWDISNIGRYYLWLCHKWGVTPNDDVVAALGISTITDKSDIW